MYLASEITALTEPRPRPAPVVSQSVMRNGDCENHLPCAPEEVTRVALVISRSAVPEIALVADAVMVNVPTVAPVTRREATPLTAVAEPRPVRVPVPLCEKVTDEVFVVSTASEILRTSAMRLRLPPVARGDVDEVMTMWYG